MNLAVQAKKNESYDKLIDSLVDLKEIQDTIAELLYQQDERMDGIEENLSSANDNIKNGLDNLIEAKKLRFKYKNVIIGGILGGLVGGPVGFITGLKYVGISTTTGSLLGGIGGYFS